MNKYRFLTLLFLLISNGVESKELTEAEKTQLKLIRASQTGDIKTLKELINNGADIDALDYLGGTALI